MMARFQTTSGELARRGFASPAAAEHVLLGWAARSASVDSLDLSLFDTVGDPDFALDSLDRIAAGDPELIDAVLANGSWAHRVVTVLGCSTVLSQHLVSHPGDLALLAEPAPDRDREWWRGFVLDRLGAVGEQPVADAEDALDRLRLANKAGLVMLAARDLTAVEPEVLVGQITRELSHLADAILEGALACARSEVPDHGRTRLAVVALGKCGANELNYISDVDVLFVAEPADDDTTPDEAIAIATKLAAGLTRACSAHTRAGTIWPVDAALRPEGKAGQLVRTLASMETYYKKWAHNWEYQAMLKARPAAGDLRIGREFVELVSPLVWQAGERANFVSDAQAMRQRVIDHIPAKDRNREIKLGPGGLRDTEFSVQLLQLVHGRADDRLHVRGTFEGLHALIENGYVGRTDGAQLQTAYAFQRVLEHRVQLIRLRRTHMLPSDEDSLRKVSRLTGIRGASELVEQWRASTRRVLRHKQRIFYSPLLEAVSRISTNELRLSTKSAQARLRSLGFCDPAQALRHIEALTTGVNRQVEIQRQLLPAMLGWFAEGPNPDFGLLAFRQISESLGATPWYLRGMRDEGSMAYRLAKICSSSRYIVDLIKRSPESVQWLAGDEELVPRGLADLKSAMARSAARHDTDEQAVASIRSHRRRELCRLALGDVAGVLSSVQLASGLSDLTTATVEAALQVATRAEAVPDIGVIAMGRWSGGELGYSSDADAMFVVADAAGPAEQKAAAAALRRMTDLLKKPGKEPALEIDVDLRPEGKGGPMVRTVSSYLSYYDRWASTWERQALLRAVPVAGELGLAAAVLAGVEDFRYPPSGLTKAEITDIRKLKLRMQTERIPKGSQPARNLKLGPGGLSDVEWVVQLLQLENVHQFDSLKAPGTLPALAELEAVGLLDGQDAESLRQAWLSATRLRNLVMLVRGRASDSLPTDALDMAAIAMLAGYEKGHASQMFEDYRKLTRQATAVVDRVFWGED